MVQSNCMLFSLVEIDNNFSPDKLYKLNKYNSDRLFLKKYGGPVICWVGPYLKITISEI